MRAVPRPLRLGEPRRMTVLAARRRRWQHLIANATVGAHKNILSEVINFIGMSHLKKGVIALYE